MEGSQIFVCLHFVFTFCLFKKAGKFKFVFLKKILAELEKNLWKRKISILGT